MLLKSKSNYNKFTSNSTFFSLPGNNKKHTADTKACQQHIHPDIRREWVKEGEDAWICAVGFVVEDADSQRHEWLREINNFFPDICDSERGHSKVGHLVKSKNHRQLQTLWRFERLLSYIKTDWSVLTWSMSSRTMPFHSPLSFWAPYLPSDTNFTS